jgi:hypothetical protein
MQKPAVAFLVYFATTCLVLTHFVRAQTRRRNPSFACVANYFTLQDFQRQPTVASPDREKSVQLTRDYMFRVVSGSTVVTEIDLPDISSDIEVGWSPDSTQFFISYSNGGAIGGYYAHMYRLNRSTLTESGAPAVVAKRFRAKHWCESRGNNLFFLAWTPDSKVAFLVAEVNPDSDCGKSMGTFRGYAVDAVGTKVLHIFGEEQTQAIEKECRASGKLVL